MKKQTVKKKSSNKLTKQQQQNITVSPKKTLLEQMYQKGLLDLPKSRFTAHQRLRCGLSLIYHYHILQKANLHSGFIFNNRIDVAHSLESKMYSDALNFYRSCLRVVPIEFWAVIRAVCFEEKLPEPSRKYSERQLAHVNFLYRIDLCRGLDRILSSQLKIDSQGK